MSQVGKALDGNQVAQDGVVKFTCATCQKENVFIMPRIEIANQLTFSAGVLAHPDPQHCEQCGTPYQMVVKEMVVTAFGINRLKSGAAPNIIVPDKKIIIPGGNS